ncbi:MAG: RluA family pseudouridine synthase [Desulfovibrionaceae bacterium]|jgi:23S rRNA pseudouridine955/2504/2580 synthase|nr:RluA family pseudouridine synthase [Desulfovibrionaceae bacterium]
MPSATQRTVSPQEAGQKLLQFLLRATRKAVPQSALLKWIRTGQVRVDSRRAKPYDRLEQGQIVRIPPHEADAAPAPDGPTPEAAPPLRIVLETTDLLAIAKPRGLPTQPGSKHADSVCTRLKALYPDAPFTPTPAHRLDRDTTGILLAAKTYETLRALNDALAAKTIRKFYLAWAAGTWDLSSPLDMRDTLAKTRERGANERVSTTADGKPASATATLLRQRPEACLLEIRLRTGRTNQIRAQLAARNHPILGDLKYQGPKLHPNRMLLHCHHVTLPDGTDITLPPDWPDPYGWEE